jgi:hypothetical protein
VSQSPDSPTALADLIAAGLVSHEVIGDPARLAEPEALKALCGLVGGPIWRIEPFHYAFRAGPGDLGGALAGRAPEDWAAAIEAALQTALGVDIWVNATDLVEAPAALDQPLLLLKAHGEAVAGALEPAGPGLQAVINARFAAATARLAVDDAGGPLAARLAALEAGQAGILAAVEARAGLDTLARLTETLAVVLQRLDAQADVMHAHIAREDMVAGRLAELAELAAGPAAFQETLGVTLAEFLARLERREAEPARVPQFS